MVTGAFITNRVTDDLNFIPSDTLIVSSRFHNRRFGSFVSIKFMIAVGSFQLVELVIYKHIIT